MDILLIHLPPDTGKKSHDSAFAFSKPINYGLLAIASYLEFCDYAVGIYDPRGSAANSAEETLVAHIVAADPKVIGLSCISGFAYPALNKISSIIKNKFPEKKIVVGGQDHVGVLSTIVLHECQAVDVVVKGEGEEVLRILLDCFGRFGNLQQVPNIAYRDGDKVIETPFTTDVFLNELPTMNYSLYPNVHEYPFAIEVSRGCPYSCEFCVEDRAKLRQKNPQKVMEEVKLLSSQLCLDNPCIYFEAPIFMYSEDELSDLAELRSREGIDFTWRAQTRVEYLATHSMESLVKAGLRVVDLGLESGSTSMLKRMGKTANPAEYLASASDVLREAFDAGILIKINLLFFVGETPDTVRETLDFLNKNGKYISAISAYPFLVYPQKGREVAVLKEVHGYGGEAIQTDEWRARHITPVNLSARLNYSDALNLARLIAKTVQSFDSFYAQKKYGYFSPQTTKLDALEASERYGIEKLPFWTNKEELQAARSQLASLLASMK